MFCLFIYYFLLLKDKLEIFLFLTCHFLLYVLLCVLYVFSHTGHWLWLASPRSSLLVFGVHKFI